MSVVLYAGTVIPGACVPSTGTPAAPGADASTPLTNELGEIPCAPRRVIQTICQQCHVSPPLNGAPFPLLTRANILATYGGSIVRDLMIEQVAAGRMPLAPVTIGDDDKDTLLAWLRSGAPAGGSAGCATDAASDVASVEPHDADDEPPVHAEPDADADAADAGGTDE